STSSWSCVGFLETCKTQGTEQNFESLQPLDGALALNEDLKRLMQEHKEQQIKITHLQCENTFLESQIKDFQMKFFNQQVFIDFTNELRTNIENLIEEKYRIILEKNEVENLVKRLQETLSDSQKLLCKSRSEKDTLMLELEKLNANYGFLQERHQGEVEEKHKYQSRFLEVGNTLSQKEEQILALQQLKEETEKTAFSALETARKEKESVEQKLQAVQGEFQKYQEVKLAERQELRSNFSKLITHIKILQADFENEKAMNHKLQQQLAKGQNGHLRLQQLRARSREQNSPGKLEAAQWEQLLNEVAESGVSEVPKALAQKSHFCLDDSGNAGLSSDPSRPYTEHCKESEKAALLVEKMKRLNLKRKSLEEEEKREEEENDHLSAAAHRECNVPQSWPGERQVGLSAKVMHDSWEEVTLEEEKFWRRLLVSP
ncbi:cancer-associated gene 1 protein, partial [Tachyglossus aculeatus]|uniref:cancer-associated gene 1 protein n=1 Tax=Tachyglossus aculeatus TaxID=9261 RepID=UPI0018F336E0